MRDGLQSANDGGDVPLIGLRRLCLTEQLQGPR